MAKLIDKFLEPFFDKKLKEMIVNGDMAKKSQELGISSPIYPTPRSLFADPFSLLSQTSYKEKLSPMTYEVLYSMAMKTEIVSAIINTRLSQIGSFTQPARYKNKTGLGFQVRFKDPKKKPNKSELEYLYSVEEFMHNCGSTNIYRSGERRDNFDILIRKCMKDSLTYDQMCWEIVPDRIGRPAEFWAIDAATIRIAQPSIQNFDVDDGRDIVKYVQVYQGQIRHTYTFQEMAFCIRNVDSNIKMNGYGHSELESLISIVTSILWAEEYNKRFFSQGQMINGILNFKDSNIPQEQLEAFRRQWLALSQSVTNAHKMPVFSAKGGMEFVNLHTSNRDMEFNGWLEFLVKITTALYLIDPAEVNFDYRGASESAPLFETSPEAKLKHSRDKGLRSLLNFIEQKVNFHIIQELDPSLYFEFVGIDMKDEQEIVNIRASEVASYKKVDEVREEAGLPPLGKDNGGQEIANPTIIQFKLQQQQLQQQQQAMATQQEQPADQQQQDPSKMITHTEGFEPQQ